MNDPFALSPFRAAPWGANAVRAEEKTLNGHEAAVTSIAASPPQSPYDPRLVSCSKAGDRPRDRPRDRGGNEGPGMKMDGARWSKEEGLVHDGHVFLVFARACQ